MFDEARGYDSRRGIRRLPWASVPLDGPRQFCEVFFGAWDIIFCVRAVEGGTIPFRRM